MKNNSNLLFEYLDNKEKSTPLSLRINQNNEDLQNYCHQQQMRQRFAKNNFDGFLYDEVLEFLLFYIFPHIDTRPIAKSLLSKFDSFSRVLDASIDELADVEGMGLNSAIALKAMRNALSYYFEDYIRKEKEQILTLSGLERYLRAKIGGKNNEVLVVIHLNAINVVIHSEIINEGTITQIIVMPRRIVETALKHNTASVIIGHNHPGGIAEPSQEDIELTIEIKKFLLLIEIELIEHMIISDYDFYSFSKEGML